LRSNHVARRDAGRGDGVRKRRRSSISATRALPEYATIQDEFARRSGDPAGTDGSVPAPSSGVSLWDESPDASRTAQRYVDLDGGQALLTVDFASLGACGEFSNALWTVAPERQAQGGSVAQSISGVGPGNVLIDVDDDGVLELVSGGTLVVSTADGSRFFGVPDAYFVCPC
jgi:hypothetical protein